VFVALNVEQHQALWAAGECRLERLIQRVDHALF
jgi:hypothetical protein